MLPPLAEDIEADVLVAGGGYTGLWAAWHIMCLEPGARVVVLEAGRCGFGPSGRNGGFCNTMWHSIAAMRDHFGPEAALDVARSAERSVAEIGRFCAERGLDAWFRPSGYMEVSTSAADDGVPERVIAAAGELGAGDAVRPLSPAEVAARCRSPLFRGGAFYGGAATVQPARLAFGLLDAVREAGVRVFEGTSVRRISREGGAVEALTGGGTVRAGRGVVAVGGASGRRGWSGRNRLTVASSHLLITEPVPDVIEDAGWTGGECITDSRALLHYFRTTPDGRIAFGWGGGRIAFGSRLGGRAEVDGEIVAAVHHDLLAIFPGLEGRRIERAWGGPIDASPSHLPVVHPDPGGRVFTAFGYTGNGVGPSHMVARTLASLALGREDEPAKLAFVDADPHGVPPEPARWIGGTAIRAAMLRKEKAEAKGRRAGPVARAVSAIPAKIGFHIGR